MKMFALRHAKKGVLMGVSTLSNEETITVISAVHSLSLNEDNVWVVADRDVAEAAAQTDTPWFNAGYRTPENKFVGALEVVELAFA